MDPGDTPADNVNFLFFCAAVIKAVDSFGTSGRRQPGAGPPAGERGPAGDHLGLPGRGAREGVRGDRVGRGRPTHPGVLGLDVLPPLPMHGGDRNQEQSPFAFPEQQVRVPGIGVEHVAGVPEHRAQHDRGRGDRRLADELEGKLQNGSPDLAKAVTEVAGHAYASSKRIIFGGDNYAEERLRGREARPQEPAHHARGAARGALRSNRDGIREVRGAVAPRARVTLRGVDRAVLHRREHRDGDRRFDGPRAAARRAAPRGARGVRRYGGAGRGDA